MILHKPFSIQFIFLPILMFVIAWLFSGCSASSNPTVNDEQPAINSTSSEVNDSTSNSNVNSSENIGAIETESGTENTSADMMLEAEVNETEVNQTEVSEVVNSSPVLEDPLIRNTIPVTFEITVPYYLSNELRVELVWGEINLTAMWVGGQYWSNGAIELARYNQNFRVGSNASESVQIHAEQFNADQFDNDGDNVNNLVELNAGTDPLVDDSLLEILDTFELSNSSGTMSRISVSHNFESVIKQDRPYVDAYETDCCVSVDTGYYDKTLFGNFIINIDTSGNGTLDVIRDENSSRNIPTLSATRTNSGNSISWAGTYKSTSPEYFFTEKFTNTVTVVDDNLRSFVQEISGSNNGTFRFSWENSANLTGKLIEGSSLCKPVAGTFTETSNRNNNSYPEVTTVVTTVSKEIDDWYWRVVILENDSVTTEYFVSDLKIANVRDDEDGESAFFKCDFVDW